MYDAKRLVADMARRLVKDEALAARLEREADELRIRFNRDFWSDERGGYYIVGLDADKLPIDSMTSNRTLSTEDRGYNPIGYYCGTIWPHDNGIVAAGLVRYGFRDEANRIAIAQIEAASFSGFRLPEAFAGFERSLSRFPLRPARAREHRANPGSASPRGGNDVGHRGHRLKRARPTVRLNPVMSGASF